MSRLFQGTSNQAARTWYECARLLHVFVGELAEQVVDHLRKTVSRISPVSIRKRKLWQNFQGAAREMHGQLNPTVTGQTKSVERTVLTNRPVIFASACIDAALDGGMRYCGGVKELNLLVKCARLNGYEAYVVTYEGHVQEWLIEHQPVVSLSEFRKMIATGLPYRCVTSVLTARPFISSVPEYYFWDMELALSDGGHHRLLLSDHRRRIKKTAAISRTVQAYQMAISRRPCVLIPNLLDESIWCAKPERRVEGQIGYMQEGTDTGALVDEISDGLRELGLEHKFVCIAGNEAAVLSTMQTCDIFLSTNPYKHPLWGEGCPRTIIESMAAGCVVVAFDVIGNRETIISGYNGWLLPQAGREVAKTTLADLLRCPEKKEFLRSNSLSVLPACHKLKEQWPLFESFLDLA